MAEIQTSVTRKRKGVRRSKKLSTKVDLTPMVDLGFLLITFFVFTTSITKPTTIKIIFPDDGEGTESPVSKTLSILLASNNVVYYYNGDSINNMHTTDYSNHGLRDVIRKKKLEVRQHSKTADETIILIKPTTDASYSNIVDALDEININIIKRYVLMDASTEETALLKQ